MSTLMIARDVIEDVRAACERTGRPTTTQEVQKALADLANDEVERIRLLARGGFEASPLGPAAIVDVLRGTDPDIAAAREIRGYYEQEAEEEALAAIRGKRRSASRVADDDDDEAAAYADAAADAADAYASAEDDVDSSDDDEDEAPAPPDALKGERVRLQKPRTQKERSSEADELLTLFAYHRDNVLVAQSLGVGLVELGERVESLGLWRSIQRLLERTTDIDVFSPGRITTPKSSGATAPVLRKRGEKPAAMAEEPAPRAASEGPAADTEPVNSYGTRVYRRTEERRPVTPAPAASAVTPAPRREYVREAKRPARHTLEKPQKAERTPPPAPVVPEKKPFSELQASQGRATLERLISDEKANPRALAAKLAERYEGPGRDVNESDLRQLLKHHGLLATFEEREVANTRFLIGFHQGARAKLSNALQMSPDEVERYLSRVGLSAELERVRAERSRVELGRKKLSDRITQVLTRAPYLDDLGILGTVDAEVREALREQFRTVETNGASGAAAADAVRTELGLEPNPFAKLLKRYDLSAKLG